MAKQSRSFLGSIYPDAVNYDCDVVLGQLETIFDKWAYILHDQDKDEHGELKKPHVQWVGQFNTPRTISNVANKLGIPENDVNFCYKFKSQVRYLVHYDNKDKFQYSRDLVFSNFDLAEYFNDSGSKEAEEVNEIINYIFEHDVRNIATLVQWCAKNGYWSTYRRAQSTFIAIIKERNAVFYMPVIQPTPVVEPDQEKGEKQVTWKEVTS